MTSPAAELYERDFYAWTQLQARELRRFAATRPNLPLDLPNLVEEVRDLGRDYRDDVRSWTARVIKHLLLLEQSPARDPRPGWVGEVAQFRIDIREKLSRSITRDSWAGPALGDSHWVSFLPTSPSPTLSVWPSIR